MVNDLALGRVSRPRMIISRNQMTRRPKMMGTWLLSRPPTMRPGGRRGAAPRRSIGGQAAEACHLGGVGGGGVRAHVQVTSGAVARTRWARTRWARTHWAAGRPRCHACWHVHRRRRKTKPAAPKPAVLSVEDADADVISASGKKLSHKSARFGKALLEDVSLDSGASIEVCPRAVVAGRPGSAALAGPQQPFSE